MCITENHKQMRKIAYFFIINSKLQNHRMVTFKGLLLNLIFSMDCLNFTWICFQVLLTDKGFCSFIYLWCSFEVFLLCLCWDRIPLINKEFRERTCNCFWNKFTLISVIFCHMPDTAIDCYQMSFSRSSCVHYLWVLILPAAYHSSPADKSSLI